MGGSSSKPEVVHSDPIAVTDRFMKDEVERAKAEAEEEVKEIAVAHQNEEETKVKAKERADALAAKVGLLKKADRCVEEEKQVVECFKQGKTDPLACLSVVERFEKCSKA